MIPQVEKKKKGQEIQVVVAPKTAKRSGKPSDFPLRPVLKNHIEGDRGIKMVVHVLGKGWWGHIPEEEWTRRNEI